MTTRMLPGDWGFGDGRASVATPTLELIPSDDQGIVQSDSRASATVLVVDEETEKAPTSISIEANFRRALSSLWLAFQPIINASDRSVFGYEALLRSRDTALANPRALLDAAERLQQLKRLGRMVRERTAQAMRNTDVAHILFVNVHPEDLLDPALLAADAPLSQLADRVVLEVTERVSLDQVPDVRSRIRALRELGFRIAVDDLGAGYASLSSFALLEPDIVKIDMSLIRDINNSPIKQKLVRAITGLCKDMGLLTVAEGVETIEESDTLIELGCELLQGYCFCRPGPAFSKKIW